jgi:very-short-patch-repair endonuclease
MRSTDVIVHRVADLRPSMVRHWNGIRVTGVEATLVALAASLDGEAFEIACEDARRRRLTSITAVRAYLDRFSKRGIPGVATTRRLLAQLDPRHPSKSTLEVQARRLLVAHGFSDFVREFPLTWNGRTRFYDFAFTSQRVILETNGRRWHDDPNDYEDDQEKWSIPGRLGYRLVFATYDKVTQRPDELLRELTATLAA